MNNIPSLTTRFSTPVDSMLIAFYHDSPFDSVSKGVETTLLALSPTPIPLGNITIWFVDVTVEARVGIEPTSRGFADLSLRPLGYRALEGCSV